MKILKRQTVLFFIPIVLGLIFALIYFLRPTLPAISSTNPAGDTVNFPTDGKIIVSFADVVKNSFRRDLHVTVNPPSPVSLAWHENGQSFVLNFPEELLPDTYLTFTVYYKKDVIHSFGLTTNPYSLKEIEEQGKKQAQDDITFNLSWNQMLTATPWYNHLPIETSEYRIVYDYELQSFRIRLLDPSGEESVLLEKALSALKDIGVQEDELKYTLLVDR